MPLTSEPARMPTFAVLTSWSPSKASWAMKSETVKPMPASAREADEMAGRGTLGQGAPGRAQREQRGAGDAKELADHQARKDGQRDRTLDGILENAAAEIDPGVGEGEQRNDQERAGGMQSYARALAEPATGQQQAEHDARDRGVHARLVDREPERDAERHVRATPEPS